MTGGYTMKEKNIRELAKRMGLITVENMCQYTIAQLVFMVANKVNELVNEVWRFETDVQEILKTQNENIQYLLGEGLHLELENIFDGWVQDGTFDTLINQSALKKVNNRIDETNARLSEIATTGTTVEAIQNKVSEMAKDGSITFNTVTPEMTTFVKSYYNMINRSKINLGKYWSSHLDSLIESDGTDVGTLQPIELKAGCVYYFNKNISSFTWIIDKTTKNKVKLKDYEGLSSFNRGVLNIKKIRVATDSLLYITVDTRLDNSNIMLVENYMPYTYKEYNSPFLYEHKGDEENKTINSEKVKIGLNGDFRDLNTFLSYVDKDYPANKNFQVDILLEDGEHSLSKEFDMPDYFNIYSISGNPNACKVIYSPESATDSDVSTYSVLRQRRNNKLKGIHFIGKNCRYVVHAESSNEEKDWTVEVENCIFEHLENNLGNWTSQFAWGEGSSSGARLKAKNCTFIAHAPNSFAYSVHNNVNFESPMLNTFDNCHFFSYGYGSCFRCEGMDSGTDDRVYLNNCELNGNIMLTNSLSIKVYAMGTTHVCCNSTNYFETNSQAIYDNFTAYLQNVSGEVIEKGSIVCYDSSYKKIRKMKNTDSVDILAGFTIGDTQPGELAFVVKDGWYRFTDDFTFGKKLGVNNGTLEPNEANKIGMIVGDGFVRIKSTI